MRMVKRFNVNDNREYNVACYVVGLPEVYKKIGGETGRYPFSWVHKVRE